MYSEQCGGYAYWCQGVEGQLNSFITNLHDKKVRIVYIKLNWTKQVLNSGVVSIAAID